MGGGQDVIESESRIGRRRIGKWRVVAKEVNGLAVAVQQQSGFPVNHGQLCEGLGKAVDGVAAQAARLACDLEPVACGQAKPPVQCSGRPARNSGIVRQPGRSAQEIQPSAWAVLVVLSLCFSKSGQAQKHRSQVAATQATSGIHQDSPAGAAREPTTTGTRSNISPVSASNIVRSSPRSMRTTPSQARR